MSEQGLGLVFVHSGTPAASLFADSVRACREHWALYVIGLYVGKQTASLGIEDCRVDIGTWHSLAAAWNCGIMRALHQGLDTVLVVNDDTILSSVGIEALVEHVKGGAMCACPCVSEIPHLYPHLRPAFPEGTPAAYETGRAAYRASNAPLPELFHRWYEPWGGFQSFCDMLSTNNRGATVTPYFHGAAFMLKADLVHQVGLFDLRFKPAYHEDVDYSRRIEQVGLASVLALDAYFHHWGSATTEGQRAWQAIFRRNEELLRQKEAAGWYSFNDESCLTANS
jgi:GT2 family glycosyltransferase